MKNKILKFIAYVDAFIFLLSVSAIDSESNIPFILTCVSIAYLALFAWANKEYIERMCCDDLYR